MNPITFTLLAVTFATTLNNFCAPVEEGERLAEILICGKHGHFLNHINSHDDAGPLTYGKYGLEFNVKGRRYPLYLDAGSKTLRIRIGQTCYIPNIIENDPWVDHSISESTCGELWNLKNIHNQYVEVGTLANFETPTRFREVSRERLIFD